MDSDLEQLRDDLVRMEIEAAILLALIERDCAEPPAGPASTRCPAPPSYAVAPTAPAFSVTPIPEAPGGRYPLSA